MKTQKAVWGKLFKAALLGAICVTPLIGSMTPAQADKPNWSQNKNDRDKNDHDKNDRNKNDRNKWDNHRGQNRSETFTGTVIKVNSSRRFDIRANGRIYNVNLDDRAPRRLDRGDIVRVVGRRTGVNNIDNAKVEIIKNR